ncbi:MAG: hypothetical protein JNL26_20115 [Gemmatimonadetes bacterium]|nr:hypothetical protein [Gemmatimonadota bacterium]
MAGVTRSLRHEYECYVEQEIENYKDSIPRSAILRIGDEAVAAMRDSEQLLLGEVVLCAEVDRIIRGRLRLPSFTTWRRRRLKLLELYRRPEHWGMAADAPLVQATTVAPNANVLVVGTPDEATTLYLTANGCQITTVEHDPDAVDRVLAAAGQVGLASRVHGTSAPLERWYPHEPLHCVVSTPAAFERLSIEERFRVIEILKSATLDGGVHLVRTLVAGQSALSCEELVQRYDGWAVSQLTQDSFIARKAVA